MWCGSEIVKERGNITGIGRKTKSMFGGSVRRNYEKD